MNPFCLFVFFEEEKNNNNNSNNSIYICVCVFCCCCCCCYSLPLPSRLLQIQLPVRSSTATALEPSLPLPPTGMEEALELEDSQPDKAEAIYLSIINDKSLRDTEGLKKKEDAVNSLGKLYCKTKASEKLQNLLVELRPLFDLIPKVFIRLS